MEDLSRLASSAKAKAKASAKEISHGLRQGVHSLTDDQSASVLIKSVQECRASATEAVALCASTLDAGSDLVECGESIRSSLAGEASHLSPDSFAVIADLIDGDKAREARGLAEAVGKRSAECVALSVRMVESLERGVEALPDFVEEYVAKKAAQSVKGELTEEERGLTARIDEGADELDHCIDAIENLHLLSAVKAGTRGFKAVKTKSELCYHVFEIIRKFASNVVGITSAVSDRDASAVIAKIKDGSILRAIGHSNYIKNLAEGCKRLMKKVTKLFRCASENLSSLWRALSRGKDAMVRSLSKVADARSLCDQSHENAEELKRMVASVDVIKLISSPGGDRGGSFDRAVGTAGEVDTGMERAASRMSRAAKLVADEYDNFPSIITDGITDDTRCELAESLGARIREVEADVRELNNATRSVEEADVISAAKTIHREISNIPMKVEICEDMIESCSDFADRSRSSVDNFLGKWSLETAVSHIKEMCRLVSFAKLVEQLAGEIHKLLKAITTLLQAMSAKIQKVAESIKVGGLDSMVGVAEDLVSDGLNSMMGKMFKKGRR